MLSLTDGGQRTRPLRIFAVVNSLIGGGAERQMLLLLRHLPRADFAPTLCLIQRCGDLFDQVPADVPVLSLQKQSPRDVGLLVLRLRRLLRAMRPDVVIAKVDYANVIAALARTLAQTHTPLVLGEESVPSLAAQQMSLPAVRLAFLRWAYQRAAVVTAPSPGVEADLRQHLGLDGGSICVIPNMIDLAQIDRDMRAGAALRIPGGQDALVVAAGRLHPSKGQADLVEAVSIVNRHRSCHLILLGDGADRQRLEGIASEFGISEKVSFLGFVSNPFPFMAGADVFVSPSHCESFGNALVEAMAVGAPVVSTRVREGPLWLIDDGRTGVFANASDPRDLAVKIERLLDDQPHAASVASAGRSFAAQFDVSRIVPRYIEILHTVIEESGRRTRSSSTQGGFLRPTWQARDPA